MSNETRNLKEEIIKVTLDDIKKNNYVVYVPKHIRVALEKKYINKYIVEVTE